MKLFRRGQAQYPKFYLEDYREQTANKIRKLFAHVIHRYNQVLYGVDSSTTVLHQLSNYFCPVSIV
jgi:hypothetical protein